MSAEAKTLRENKKKGFVKNQYLRSIISYKETKILTKDVEHSWMKQFMQHCLQA